jgi:hypothetical protein
MKSVLSFVLLFTAFCARGAEPPALKDGNYTLKVTHSARHPAVQFPHSPIPEKEYQPAKDQPDIQLRFLDQGRKVVVQPKGAPGKAISGKLEKASADGRIYQLTEGLFAGGSLTLKQTNAGFIATYTIYGSGVPIIASFRGPVEPADQRKQMDDSGVVQKEPSHYEYLKGKLCLMVSSLPESKPRALQIVEERTSASTTFQPRPTRR